MKKLLCLLSAMVMVVSLSACCCTPLLYAMNKENKVEKEESFPLEDSFVEEMPTTTTTTTTTTAPAVEKVWELSYYVDDFNDPTDEWYVYSTFKGTFSNSVTNDSALSGGVIVDAEDVTFILYEYESSQVKNIFSTNEEYTIRARAADGSETTFDGVMYSNGDRIFVVDSQVAGMKTWLRDAGSVRFYIYENESPTTNYLFEVKSGNLGDYI